VNNLSNLDKTYREYSLAPAHNRIRFWRSKVKVTAGHLGGEAIHGVKIHLLVANILTYIFILGYSSSSSC